MLPACLAATRSVLKDAPRTLSFIATALSLLLGFLVYHIGQGLDPVDAIYLTVVTISTVGYGDISPSTEGMRVFTCVYILFGSTYVFAQLANLFGGVLHAFSNLVKRGIDQFDRADKVASRGSFGDAMVSGRSLAKTSCPGQMGRGGKANDLNGDGHADFIEPPTALVYWAQELLPALLLLMLLQIASAGIFAHLLPEVSFATALYHCFITATTVGYGDVPITTRAAQWHKWPPSLPSLPSLLRLAAPYTAYGRQQPTIHSLLPYTRATARRAAWNHRRLAPQDSRLAKLPRVPAPHCILGRLSVTPSPPHPRTHAPTHPYTSTPPQSPHLSAPLHLCTSAQARGEALRVRAHRSLGSVARHVEPCPHEPYTKTHSSPNPNLSSNP